MDATGKESSVVGIVGSVREEWSGVEQRVEWSGVVAVVAVNALVVVASGLRVGSMRWLCVRACVPGCVLTILLLCTRPACVPAYVLGGKLKMLPSQKVGWGFGFSL